MDNDKMLPQASAIILEEQTNLTISEVCQACAVRVETILELVDEGVLLPIGREPHRWATVAIRLQRDLGVNLAGAALAMQLLDELEALHVRLRKVGVQ